MTLVLSAAVIERPALPARKSDMTVIAGIGLMIITADTMYTTATTLGLIGVIAVLGSLHTIVTLALARLLLGERLARSQQVGAATSVLGVLVISAA